MRLRALELGLTLNEYRLAKSVHIYLEYALSMGYCVAFSLSMFDLQICKHLLLTLCIMSCRSVPQRLCRALAWCTLERVSPV